MLFVAIVIILIAILILYMLVVKSTPRPIYYPTLVSPEELAKQSGKPLPEVATNEKEKMFQTYFPSIPNEIKMDYPLKPIGCCPPSKELSKDLPVANIPMCYAKDSKTHLQ